MTPGVTVTPSYWVVIPAYNEAATVRGVAMRARQQCDHVIVVDDGSSDGTGQTLDGVDVTVLRNHENLGKASSLAYGFEHALAHGAAGVITLDADNQHAPEEIPLLIKAARAGPDDFLVGARRRKQRRVSFWRYAANGIADFWIGWAAGHRIEDSQSGFRLYPAKLLRELAIPHGRTRSFVFESEVVIEAARHGYRCRNVTISVTPRGGSRTSHFRPLRDIARITRMVAWKLLSRGLFLQGLYRSLRQAENFSDVKSEMGGELSKQNGYR